MNNIAPIKLVNRTGPHAEAIERWAVIEERGPHEIPIVTVFEDFEAEKRARMFAAKREHIETRLGKARSIAAFALNLLAGAELTHFEKENLQSLCAEFDVAWGASHAGTDARRKAVETSFRDHQRALEAKILILEGKLARARPWWRFW